MLAFSGGPLSGLSVVDLSRVLAGPLATMTLADLGADVVKIERPEVGDETRHWGPPFADGESTYFLSVNRNKRSAEIDLASPQGRADVLALVDEADVLVENFSVGTIERLGLGWDVIRARNPRLVLCSISGFGRHAGATLPGYDLLIQAAGGLMSITGETGREPTKTGVALVDVIAGLHATIGILAALAARDETGLGQRVDVNLMSSLLSSLVNQGSAYVAGGTVPVALGNRHPSIAPYELLTACDGQLALTVGNDGQFRALCDALELPALAESDLYRTNAGRVGNRDALAAALTEVLLTASVAHWTDYLNRAGVPCGPVNDVAAAFAFAAELGLDPIQIMERRDASSVGQISSPLSLSASPVSYRLPPPRLGEHTHEVLGQLRQRRSPGLLDTGKHADGL